MTKSVFHTKNLTKVYQVGDREIHALRGIDLDLYPKEFVVMLGASGSVRAIW